MSNTTVDNAKTMGSASDAQASQALVIQGYCNSVNAQAPVDFSGFDKLSTLQTEMNTGLGKAKSHANNYLNVIQPAIITNVTNISAYYNLHQAAATVLVPGSTKKEWTDSLAAIRDQSLEYIDDADDIVKKLTGFYGDLSMDSSAFNGYVQKLNNVVNGDNGLLQSMEDDLDSIQSKIDGAIAGTVLSGFAIAGGVFMIAVGGVAEFVTAGTSTALVVAGVGVVAAGVAGEVGSAVALAGLMDQKAELLTNKAKLNDEVKLASGISKGYGSLASQAQDAMKAATEMKNAWVTLNGELDSLVTDLNKGIKSTDTLRKLWITAANAQIKNVLESTDRIKDQMAGVTTATAPSGTSISEFTKNQPANLVKLAKAA